MSFFRMSQILIWFLCACSLWWFLIHYIIFYRVFTYSGSGRDLAPVQLQAYVLKETVVCKNCLTCRCWGYIKSGGEDCGGRGGNGFMGKLVRRKVPLRIEFCSSLCHRIPMWCSASRLNETFPKWWLIDLSALQFWLHNLRY